MAIEGKDWLYLGGVAVGGILIGTQAASIFSKSEPIYTSIGRPYRVRKHRKTEVLAGIYVNHNGKFVVDFEVPYGFRTEDLTLDFDLEPDPSPEFDRIEDAAKWADDQMERIGYKPHREWDSTLSWEPPTRAR